MRYKILPVLLLLVTLVMAACTTAGSEGEPVSSEMQDGSVQMVVVPNAHPESNDGSNTGLLELNITFENPSEQEVALNLDTTDYVLTTADGIELTPSTLSPEMQAITIPAGGSVSGAVGFSVLSPSSTFTLNVEGFEAVTIDAAVDEGLEAESRG
jgi:hypothetical protein